MTRSLSGLETITISRSILVDEAFLVYDDPLITSRELRVEFIGESGDDFGGLTKDFFTNVWKELLKSFFSGEDAVVPHLPVHRARLEKEKYRLIGRFISHGAAIMNMLPPRLSRCCLLAIVYDDASVDDELLLDDFL